jgi:hypothetical protein
MAYKEPTLRKRVFSGDNSVPQMSNHATSAAVVSDSRPVEQRLRFCIRDDDTSFFTQPEQLERAYGRITKQGPVSLAVVPFCRAGTSKGVPESARQTWTVHPLHKNTELVTYLRSMVTARRFEIMLHGYHHDEPDGQPEFIGGEELARKVREGRDYLNDLLATRIRVFVPPHNAIGRRGLRGVAEAGLHLGGAAGVRGGWPLMSAGTWALWWRLRGWRRGGGVGVPWVLDLGDHREIAGCAITPWSPLERNRLALDLAVEARGVFCAATHYWELETPSQHPGDPTVGEHLNELIKAAVSQLGTSWESVGDVVCCAR